MGELDPEMAIFYIVMGILIAMFFIKTGQTPVEIKPIFQAPAVNQNIDNYGCDNSRGMFWCDYTKRCIHPPEELCQPPAANMNSY